MDHLIKDQEADAEAGNPTGPNIGPASDILPGISCEDDTPQFTCGRCTYLALWQPMSRFVWSLLLLGYISIKFEDDPCSCRDTNSDEGDESDEGDFSGGGYMARRLIVAEWRPWAFFVMNLEEMGKEFPMLMLIPFFLLFGSSLYELLKQPEAIPNLVCAGAWMVFWMLSTWPSSWYDLGSFDSSGSDAQMPSCSEKYPFPCSFVFGT